ncbi:30S ribosomal protein S21 [Candidatus Giovannonibacteria bacterium RIFCSPLOWO2_01_FULL_43_160]|uniref:Small ribosomal subunit protein bS21 n=3 Tax=Parcubacteria group TaxID=1794811 RepID=A0A0G1IXR5_9BACT|nr:MAG: hypothetical protein UV72_C0001G0099 [Candidatus Giovannonibacteria bacterium GW2011_GWB1_43_13]KKS99698.1 MAG: hypothetical protein UV75_C0002G0079 [Candidatus Giovannonibacteria bacterium GW2011_GWA1_43_15]KKT21892.1 MAG: hypothetical protein UW05_C0001G0039 [Candidatus Giovannonibacteria bacterium GW2011_GWC2_43_8]KKT63783.1 MAG: hypothetical protein UW55_C0001G0076 [Candidatus Giovannonibacteria bacterium GW2011_GWA2_44_26]OGF58244.1 MAG: 30S ribosomal protein S21 [Candidatus Giovan
MVEVRKRENESAGSLLRRFTKILQRSGFLAHARKGRYHISPQSAFQKKREALRRLDWEKNARQLRKLGKIKQVK